MIDVIFMQSLALAKGVENYEVVGFLELDGRDPVLILNQLFLSVFEELSVKPEVESKFV